MFSPGHVRVTLESLSAQAASERARGCRMEYAFVRAPLGRCLVGEIDDKICYMAFAPKGSERQRLADLSARWPEASLAGRQAPRVGEAMTAAFGLSASADAGIALLVRGTDFQAEVWRALLDIPPGSVSTYAGVAQSVGRPKAIRAVASAIAANPVAWWIPCHRVVRSDGQLGGYRWGTAMKKACLDFEKQATRAGE